MLLHFCNIFKISLEQPSNIPWIGQNRFFKNKNLKEKFNLNFVFKSTYCSRDL